MGRLASARLSVGEAYRWADYVTVSPTHGRTPGSLETEDHGISDEHRGNLRQGREFRYLALQLTDFAVIFISCFISNLATDDSVNVHRQQLFENNLFRFKTLLRGAELGLNQVDGFTVGINMVTVNSTVTASISDSPFPRVEVRQADFTFK